MGSRLRGVLCNLLLLAVSLVFVAASLEVLMRLAPRTFGDRVGNGVLGRYGRFPGGIYFVEPTTHARFMWPDFETRAYWNGYFWHHRTDSRGFRNPPGRTARVLLLGDSMVYGHGVEEDQVVAHFLRREHGRQAYDMSRQGDCLYQHYLNLRLHLATLRPQAVVLFAFLNDWTDLEYYRTREQLERMPELGAYDYDEIGAEVVRLGAHPPARIRRLARGLVAPQLVAALGHVLDERLLRSGRTGRHRPEWWAGGPLPDAERRDRIARYYDRALGDLATRCARLGVRLVLVHLDMFAPDQTRAEALWAGILRTAAASHAVAYFDTGDLLSTCEACVLPGDGHLSETGHRRLATFVDAALDRAEVGARAPAADAG